MVHGRFEPGYEPLVNELREILSKPPYGGAALCLYQHGRPVVDVWAGARNPENDPWQRDTPSVSYSTSKGVTATALHILKDRGLVEYDAPIATYWPEFAQNGKGDITVRQALTHSAGLYNVRKIVDHADVLLDWDATVAAIAAAPAKHPPGVFHAYHAVTFGHLIGEIVQRVSGRPFSRFVQDEIAAPLDLQNFFIGAPDEAIARAARNMAGAPGRPESALSRLREGLKRRRLSLLARGLNIVGIPMSPQRMFRALRPYGIEDWDFSSPEVLRACIPAANGLFAARDLARFYAMLGNGGTLHGARLLSAKTVAEATKVHARGPDGVLVAPMRWRLGYHAVFTKHGVMRGAFGHSGYNGSGAWASPQDGLALGYVVNAGFGTPFGDWRILKLTTTARACHEALKRRPSLRTRSDTPSSSV